MSAMQLWALSPIPSVIEVFLSFSLLNNSDDLFWRAKKVGARENDLPTFSGTMWFIWKARNCNIFKEFSESSQDTLSHAIQEAEE